MKALKINWITAFAAIVMLAGCKKQFDEYSQNKNLPLQVPPSLLLPNILNGLVVYPGGDVDKWNQNIVSNYDYYGNNEYWSGSASLDYGYLRDVDSMQNAALKLVGDNNNPYYALGLFFRAFFYVDMTMKVGDVPLTEALQGLTNTTPVYDAQEDIFKQALSWLDSANLLLSQQIPLVDVNASFFDFAGDFYYKERLSQPLATPEALRKWQKVVNTYKLRLLIELSKRTDDASLNVKQQFAAIYNNPSQYPIFESNVDNLQYVYNSTYNYYPDNPTNYGNNQGRLNIAATLLDNLSSLNDIRAMIFAEPARGLGFSDTSYSSFKGGASGLSVSALAALSGSAKISLYNYNHFYSTYTAEPTLILSYPEMCFSIAEAINRGWISGDANTWYQNGIKSIWAFYGIVDGTNTVTFINGGGNISYNKQFSFNTYLNQASVKYKGNNSDGLAQILLQKYLAYARNSGLQAYYQWRRTGIPAFSTGSGNGNGGVIPKRFQYPNNEISANGSNLQAALQSQYNGNDDIFALMWLVK